MANISDLWPILYIGKAKARYFAAHKQDLTFQEDDELEIRGIESETWLNGRNVRTGDFGSFPKCLVTIIQDFTVIPSSSLKSPSSIPPPLPTRPTTARDAPFIPPRPTRSINKDIPPLPPRNIHNTSYPPLLEKLYRYGDMERGGFGNLDEYDFTDTDNWAIHCPADRAMSIRHLSEYLTRPFDDPILKARAIFTWICYNIAYDVDSFMGRRHRASQSPDAVLQSKAAVCEGYSKLYTALATQANLRIQSVSGASKGFGYSAESTDINNPSGHAWNIMELDGHFRMIESTWGAGFLNNNSEFTRRFCDGYFLVPPHFLIFTHFPQKPSEQFLPEPISGREWLNLPKLQGRAFKRRLKILKLGSCSRESQSLSHLEMDSSEEVEIKIEMDFANSHQHLNEALVANFCFANLDFGTSKNDALWLNDITEDRKLLHTIRFHCPPGTGTLTIFENNTDKLKGGRNGNSIFSINLSNKSKSSVPCAPDIFRPVSLIEPHIKVLPHDSVQTFRFRLYADHLFDKAEYCLWCNGNYKKFSQTSNGEYVLSNVALKDFGVGLLQVGEFYTAGFSYGIKETVVQYRIE